MKSAVFAKSVRLSGKTSKYSFLLTKYFILSDKWPAKSSKSTMITYRTVLQNWVLSSKNLQLKKDFTKTESELKIKSLSIEQIL